VDSIDLAKSKDLWRALANMVTGFPFLQNCNNILTTCTTISFLQNYA